MNGKTLAAGALALAACAGLGTGQAMAAGGNWSGNGTDNTWGNATNWAGGTIAGSTTTVNADVMNIPSYGGSAIPTHTTINLDSDRYIGSIDIWSDANITIESTDGHTLYWNGGGNYVRPEKTFKIDVPVVTLTGTRISPTQSGSKEIFNKTVTFDAAGTNPQLQFLSPQGLVQFNGAITGPGGLYANGGTGRVELNVANSFSGSSNFNSTDITVVLNAAGAWPENLALTFARGGNLEINQTNAITGSSSVTLGPISGMTQVMTANRSNNYTGDTTISTSNGALFANNPNDGGSATGSGNVVVNGTIGGAGYIKSAGTNGMKLNTSGAKLSPGASTGLAGTLTLALGSGGLNLAAATNGTDSASLLFDLDTTANSDKVLLTGGPLTVSTSTNKLEFGDFTFSALPGFGPGTYTLFDTDSTIVGSLGSTLSGSIGAYTGTLSLADGGRDVVLTVVPEPGTLGLLAIGGLALLGRRRRMASASKHGGSRAFRAD